MSGKRERLEFKVHGMDCAEEVTTLKRAVGPLVGGEENLAFDILRGKMIVSPASQELDPRDIVRVIERAGLKAELWRTDRQSSTAGTTWQRLSKVFLTAASGLFSLGGFVAHAIAAGGLSEALGHEGVGHSHVVPLAAKLLYTMGIIAGAWHVIPKALAAARVLRPDMNLLMTIAVLGAVGIGEWFEAATVTFLFAVSLVLEAWSVGRARRAVEALLDLTPPTARLQREDGSEVEVPPEQIEVGVIFTVKPGERIPLDGRVVRGSSEVNQAPITGESVPIEKGPNDEVYAGTINGDGALAIESTKPAEDTTLARIIRMVGEASSRRAPSEQWVERFARVYTPAVLALAAAVFLVPPLALEGSWALWFYRSLVLLVIGCPCALVISTPVSIVAALACAARNGVLVKGGVHLETPAQLQAIAFDKTGTLTEGEASVVEVIPLAGHTEKEVLERAAAMEARSSHPIARAVIAHAKSRRIDPIPADDFQVLPGKGAAARFNGKTYWLGSHRYLEERGQETGDVHQKLEALAQAGRTVVVIGNESHVCGIIALADAVRPEARAVLQSLRDAKVKHIVMLTGDSEGTAREIARQTGVDEVLAELLPEDKVAAMQGLVARFGSVAMVGDGVNDAPVLGRATLGIAMGAAGSDAAIEAADIALMSDDLAKIPWLVHHSRRTVAVVRQNITFALSVKAVFVILTFLGQSSLWGAIAADMGASLLVIFNGLRLLTSKRAR
jgi:Cd2+/Zn2+-exporting ATPase